MSEFSYLHAPVLSFFSRAVYRDAAIRWRGRGLVYLLFTTAVMLLPDMVATQMALRRVASEVLPQVLPQLPRLTIDNGVASTDPPGEHVIRDPRNGHAMVILDTTVPSRPLVDADARLLITRDQMVMRDRDGNTQAQPLADIDGVVVDAAWVMTMLQAVKVLAVPTTVFLFYFWHLLMALTLAMMGRMYTARLPAQLKPAVCMRLAVLALTPAVVVGSVLRVMDLQLQGWFFVSTMASVAYMLFGIHAVYAPEEEDPEEEDGGF